jgi:AAA ATPase-like protein
MASVLKQAETQRARIETYLRRIANFLPATKHDADLLVFISPILTQDKGRNKSLRRAFGFPAKVQLSRKLHGLLASPEPSLRPLISVCAQRIYQFAWRLKATVREIDASWREDVMPRIEAAQRICEPHLVAKWPTLLDLSGALKSQSDFTPIIESAADPTLFAVLRAFGYNEEDQPLAVKESELKELQQSALEFLFRYLQDVIEKKRSVDDSSNIWWAVRVGLCEGDERFLKLIDSIAEGFRKTIVPGPQIQTRSVVPEIYKDVRTASYTLSNIQAILEAGVKIDDASLESLKKILQVMINVLVKTPHSTNLYLASAHYEGLRNYVDYSEDQFFANKVRDNTLKFEDLTPLVDYACGDPGLEEQIRDVRSWLEKKPARRNSLLVYGASSTGKSFLVEKLFKQFEQERYFEGSRIVCAPDLDFPSALRKVAEDIYDRQSESYPPFLYIDEIDVEFPVSIYPQLLRLLDKGAVEGFDKTLDRFVLFWGGGKHGSVENFKKFLTKYQKLRKFEKGLDFYNRAKKRIDLPFSLFRNKNHKIMVGVAEIAKKFGLPIQVSRNVISELKYLLAERGAREFGPFVERLELDNSIVVIRGEPASGNPLTVIK